LVAGGLFAARSVGPAYMIKTTTTSICAESVENVAGVSDAIGISADSIKAVCVGHRRLDVFF
jgi:hypothetical protein